jgi:hypothetical protein
MDGLGGLEGWRWIFIMLGVITIVTGAIGWLLIVDFPETANFITEEERRDGECYNHVLFSTAKQHPVIHRLDLDRGDGEHDALTAKKVLVHLSDWKIWALSVVFGCATMPSYALAYFV